MGSKGLKSGIKRKHVTLTIINKLKVIEQLENDIPGKNKIAEEFSIGQQIVSDTHYICQQILFLVSRF
jgi:YbbR domain-containing protein